MKKESKDMWLTCSRCSLAIGLIALGVTLGIKYQAHVNRDEHQDDEIDKVKVIVLSTSSNVCAQSAKLDDFGREFKELKVWLGFQAYDICDTGG